MAQLHRIRAVDLRLSEVIDEIVAEHLDAAADPEDFCRRVVGIAGTHLREPLAMPQS